MKPRLAYVYECWYCVAEFGEEVVVVEADNCTEANQKINEWCRANHCCHKNSPSGAGPKPRLLRHGFFADEH